jgi:hypothetical protein
VRRAIVGALFWAVFWLTISVVAAVSLLSGCSTATQQRGRRAPLAQTQVVAQHRIYRAWQDWEASPWSRPGDSYAITPVNLLVSEQGYGCIVEPGDWVLAQERVRFACESGWRSPRPR